MHNKPLTAAEIPCKNSIRKCTSLRDCKQVAIYCTEPQKYCHHNNTAKYHFKTPFSGVQQQQLLLLLILLLLLLLLYLSWSPL